MAVTAQETLEYHRRGRPGKIEVTPTKPMLTQRDLSLAYTPGVAEVVLEIERNANSAYEYTAKANLVAVISNGTAILGLGDRGALAAKPVMEGKGVLFKRFADVDVFDIEVDSHDPHTLIQVVKAIAPTFGGINLEDIKSPECFFIEKTLQEQLDIPVFHDDQHGTAIIASAALLNYLEITGKPIAAIKVVFSGAGAAAVATANMFVTVGVPRQNIWMCDIAGLIYHGRKQEMFAEKAKFAQGDQPGTLAEALVEADVFIGLSVANLVTQDMVKAMKPQPLILAMANPDPEIKYEEARAARPDAIVCTGRSDYPNQVNNVLGFPFIFRGALDVQARAINEEMKAAAAKALAALAHEDVPDAVLNAYNLTALKFGLDYIIPKPLDPRVMLWVSPAVAEAAMHSGVARKQLNLTEYRERLAERLGSGVRLRRYIINKAKAAPKRLVFPEGEEATILRAAAVIADEAIGQPILIGRPEIIQRKVQELGLHFAPQVVDPGTDYRTPKYARAFYELRQRRGLTLSQAQRRAGEANTFGLLMVQQGDADACVVGLTHEYPEVIRPALQIFHTRSGVHKAAGAYIVIAKDNVYIFSDATVNIDPTSEDLAEIAVLAADLAEKLNLKPRVALISFSNFGSAPHPLSNKVRHAVELVRARRPELAVDGEMQADVAITPELIETRYPFSTVKNANVLVFPDLEAANVAYKLMKRLGQAQTIGPILLGVGAPVHVLQAGDDVDEIVSIAAVAVIDAQGQL
ncbi:malate dehydrogenase (oxaloacetate-decarboxylating)(NADP+) [Thermoflexales bacterium]|nr:malate dehydrogenase (oxaloacetate-decarboxylating)(NADP+) [Thermoflexales bacterium]